jgi:hypothetical protein
LFDEWDTDFTDLPIGADFISGRVFKSPPFEGRGFRGEVF